MLIRDSFLNLQWPAQRREKSIAVLCLGDRARRSVEADMS